MSILTRFAAVMIIAGLIAGLILRVVVKGRYLRSLMLVGMVPWLVHMLVVVIAALSNRAPVGGVLVFAAAGFTLATVGTWFGWRQATKRAWLMALTPLLVALAYLALPVLVFGLWLNRLSIPLDSFVAVVYMWGSLFATSALLVLAPRTPVGPWRLKRRR